ncbi:hypothetical protein [Desulfonatronospira sp.]|uniref:hypothetical protein n=1 Tax=Desulfonatronospira sp. TaxID=1962951 RepID=UPI0025C33C4A|nr:hypothetical protein [Desulfonatronospira sp.]
MDIQASSPGNTTHNPANQLSSPEFRDMVRAELSDILADFIATQEKRASQVSLIERIVRVEEAQRSHEQLTKALLEQMNQCFEAVNQRFESMNQRFESINQRFEAVDKRFESMNQRFESMNQRFESMDKRFEDMNRRLDRFMFWSLGLTVTATFLIITVLR